MLDNPKAFLFSFKGLSFANAKDDFGFVEEAFNKKNIQILEVFSLPKTDRAFVVLSGSDLVGVEEAVSEELLSIRKVVLFITSDECGDFNVEKINHPNIIIWKQYPYKRHAKYFKMPIGVPMTMKNDIPQYTKKINEVFFAGQITHSRRRQLEKAIKNLGIKNYLATPGFMQGDPRSVYYSKMIASMVVPAPAGIASIDSFRFYEALEMLALPIADTKTSKGKHFDFWSFLFDGETPTPKTSNWHELGDILSSISSDYPGNMHQAVSWWIKYKRDFSNKIMEQINEE
jgi:hypothetical protein